MPPNSHASAPDAMPVSTASDPAPQAPPPGFVPHAYEKRFVVPHGRAAVWAWLCDPATFVEGQVGPYRVEFVHPQTGAPAGFEEGVLTVHHGPLINFAGVLGEIRPRKYRDLRYFYGSYALSLRLIRPTRLQFWLDDLGGVAPGTSTVVRLRLDSVVRSWLSAAWTQAQSVFWGRFPRWMQRSLGR